MDTGGVMAITNILRLTQNDSHFAHSIFNSIFLNENCCILINTSLEFVPKGTNDNESALVQMFGAKLLSEPMMT